MSDERWRKLQEVFQGAADLPETERARFLDSACSDDDGLRREVESLLAHHQPHLNVLERAIADDISKAFDKRLEAGTELGPYRVEELIGAGSMGYVYRAQDSRLGRAVAIKIAKERFDERFQREARAISSLNHPNICTLYDVGPNYMVMELVEGPTLAHRIDRGRVPLNEALAIARQVKDGLAAAHDQGMVHRDLKPSSIKVKPDGSVKILDFGLSKISHQLEQSIEQSRSTMTDSGLILGTPAYMAPEQARGERVDRRADIWAFGVVLYEMVTGRKPFRGDNPAEVLASVIKDEPDFSQAPSETRLLLQRCLTKDSRYRLRDIGDAMTLLEMATETARKSRFGSAWIAWSAAAVSVSIIVGVALRDWRRGSKEMAAPVARLTMEMAPAEMLDGDFSNRPSHTAIAFSPDGKTVIFSGRRGAVTQLYKRELDQPAASAMSGTEGGIEPFFSPDGRWVGFWADDKLKKIARSGGPAVVICSAPAAPGTVGLWGASWGPADTIVFARPTDGVLMRVSADGGTPEVLLKPSSRDDDYMTPELLGDGKTLLFTIATTIEDESKTVVRRLDTGIQRVLLKGGSDVRFVSTGHLVYVHDGTLMAAPFDAHRIALTGPAVPMIDDVMQAANEPAVAYETWMGQFSISASGSLLYASGGVFPPQYETLVSYDRRSGAQTDLKAHKAIYRNLRVSPDGSRLAAVEFLPTNPAVSDIWVLDMKRRSPTRLTSQAATPGINNFPVWSRDGRRILFHGGNWQMLSIATDGSTPTESLLPGSAPRIPASLSQDGKWLAYIETHDRRNQIWTRSMPQGEPKRFAASEEFNYTHPAFSPNGRWMAYVSDESGSREVHVQPFPGPGMKMRISTNGGTGPVWSPNGRELFYTEPAARGKSKMMVVDILPGDGLNYGAPRSLFEGSWLTGGLLPSYDITPDGQHFIMAQPEDLPDQRVTKLNIVLNWFDELRRRAPGKAP